MAIASVSVQQALAVLVDTWFEQDGNHADAPRVSTRGLFIDPPPSLSVRVIFIVYQKPLNALAQVR